MRTKPAESWIRKSNMKKRYTMQLLQAIKENRSNDFKSLLDSECKLLNSDLLKYNLLKKALYSGRTAIARLLLKKGCPLNYLPNDNSPLHIAVLKKENLSIIKTLLAYGASIVAKNKDGDTPLHASFIDQPIHGVIDILLEHCRDVDAPNVANGYGLSFLHIACTRRMFHVVLHFIFKDTTKVNCRISPNHSSEFAGYTPLHFAVESGQLSVAEVLLYWDADIYVMNRFNSTPLHLATEKRDIAMIELLFKYDELLENPTNKFGLSHFMASCMCKNRSIFEDFLNIVNPNNRRRSLEMSNLINTSVADDKIYIFAGYTPLQFAAEFGRTEIAEILIEAGVEIYKRNSKGLTAVNLACLHNQMDTAEAIISMSEVCAAYERSVVEQILMGDANNGNSDSESDSDEDTSAIGRYFDLTDDLSRKL